MQKFATPKKTLAIAAIVLTVAGAGVFGIANANAQTATTDNPMSSLVQKIATKFNLNQNEVQAVFDQEHAERHAQMDAQYEQRLSQLVTDGKITEQQKQLILNKHKEMQANRETEMAALQNMTDEERRAAMEKKRTELENWAKDNNIELQYVMPFGKGGHGGKMKFIYKSHATPQGSPSAQTQ